MCRTRVKQAYAYGTWAKNDAREWPERGTVPSSPYISHTDRHIYPQDKTPLMELPGVELGQPTIQLTLHTKDMPIF